MANETETPKPEKLPEPKFSIGQNVRYSPPGMLVDSTIKTRKLVISKNTAKAASAWTYVLEGHLQPVPESALSKL